MPYVILKRSDVENGVVQVLDLEPNTSLRNLSIDPPGQTKYVRVPLNESVVTYGAGPVLTFTESRGLASWFITNVPADPAVAASQTGQVDAGGLSPGDTITIGTTVLTAVAAAPVANEFVVTGAQLADTTSLVNAINNPNNDTNGVVTAADDGGGQLTVTAVVPGTAGNLIATTETSATFAWGAGTLAGGADGVALTATEANTIAANIFANLLRFGDNANPALPMTLAAVNAEIAAVVATSLITAAQLTELLDILSGRLYVVPVQTQIEDGANAWVVSPAVGSDNGPRFIDPSFRRSYDDGYFVVSWEEGHLYTFRQENFEYKGVQGAMLAVFNDDGSLYTPPVM